MPRDSFADLRAGSDNLDRSLLDVCIFAVDESKGIGGDGLAHSVKDTSVMSDKRTKKEESKSLGSWCGRHHLVDIFSRVSEE